MLKDIYNEQLRMIEELEELAESNVALAREWMESSKDMNAEGIQDVFDMLSAAEKAMMMADKIRNTMLKECLSQSA